MNTALLPIDIQNDYFPGGRYPLHDPEKAAGRAARLLTFFRTHKMPVFHVRHLGGPDTPFLFPTQRELKFIRLWLPSRVNRLSSSTIRTVFLKPLSGSCCRRIILSH
jgi:nicotinamidase-related amidase